MAFVHGKSAHFAFGNTGSETNLSTYIDGVEFPEEGDAPETTTYGKTARTYIPGLKDSTISVTGKWDSVLDGVLGAAQLQTGKSFIFGPAGNGTGAVKYSGVAILMSYSISAPVDDVVTFSAEFQVSDEVTRDTFA